MVESHWKFGEIYKLIGIRQDQLERIGEQKNSTDLEKRLAIVLLKINELLEKRESGYPEGSDPYKYES